MRIRPALPKILSATVGVKPPLQNIQEALPNIKSPFPAIKGLFFVEGGAYYNLIRYYGGKYHQLGNTLPYIEMVAEANEAQRYIECFGGGGKCILNLDTIGHHFDSIIYNEWDKGLCNLFEATANPELAKQMIEKLNTLDYSQETFKHCMTHRLDEGNSLLDTAYMTFVTCQMSFNGNMDNFEKVEYNQGHGDSSYSFSNTVERIIYAPEHLQGLEVVNGDYREIMKLYGEDKHSLKYLDPPYHPACREKNSINVYQNELTKEQHKELVEILCKSRSWVMSGYDPAQYGCDDYKPLEDSGAIKESIGLYHVPSSGKDIYKEEFIWYKF